MEGWGCLSGLTCGMYCVLPMLNGDNVSLECHQNFSLSGNSTVTLGSIQPGLQQHQSSLSLPLTGNSLYPTLDGFMIFESGFSKMGHSISLYSFLRKNRYPLPPGYGDGSCERAGNQEMLSTVLLCASSAST